MSRNALVTLPDYAFSGLKVIKSITLFDQHDNKLVRTLKSISSKTFYGLTTLTEIKLQGNALSEILPGTFDGLTSLTA
eukprot:Pgem_evm1s8277